MAREALEVAHSFCDESELAAYPESVGALSATELLVNYPARVVMTANGERLLLQRACLLGVLSEMSELWLRLEKGEQAPSAADFYGEYELMLKRDGQLIECVDAWGGGVVRVEENAFRRGVADWSRRVFDDIESRIPRIRLNEKYNGLRQSVLTAWAPKPATE